MNDRLRRFCVRPSATIRQTLAAIDAGSVEIAIVTNDDDRVVGTVSDGDVRRALLTGASLDDEVAAFVQHQFTWVAPGSGRADVLDLMRARFVSQVPVLDAKGRLAGLHIMRELLGVPERRNVAVIMAGGRGTRLAPFTEHLPKPMMPVAGRPILERIVLHLVGYGVPVVYLAVNYMADVITDHFGDGARFGCEIRYLVEDTERPLGSAGALALLPPEELQQATPILVLNGDLVTQFDVDGLLRTHEAGGYAATVGVRKYSHDVPFGVLQLDGTRVVGLEEKPRHMWDVNGGVYVLDPRLIGRVPRDRQYMMTELLGECLRHGDPVGAYLLEGDWVDVGHIEELRRARGEAR